MISAVSRMTIIEVRPVDLMRRPTKVTPACERTSHWGLIVSNVRVFPQLCSCHAKGGSCNIDGIVQRMQMEEQRLITPCK